MNRTAWLLLISIFTLTSCASAFYHKVDASAEVSKNVVIVRGPVRIISVDDFRPPADFSRAIVMAPGVHTITFAGFIDSDALIVSLKRDFPAGHYAMLCPGFSKSNFQDEDAAPEDRWTPFIRSWDQHSVTGTFNLTNVDLCHFAFNKEVEGILPEITE